jgi:hypothetical protein
VSAAPPTLPRSSPLFVLLAVLAASADNFADPDLWMHILVGRTIRTLGYVPTIELFSYSAPGYPSRGHEWLAQVLLSLTFDHLGIYGLRAFKLFCAAGTIVAMVFAMAETRAPRRVQRIVLIVTAAGILTQVQFRPQLFTLLFLAVLLDRISAQLYRGRVTIWPLVPMFTLWSNLHGGFIAGLGALGIATGAVGAQDVAGGRGVARAARLGALTAAAALATLLNPRGPNVWLNVVHSLGHPLASTYIADWASVPAAIAHAVAVGGPGVLEFVVPLVTFATFVVALAGSRETDDAPLVAIALVFIAAALYASRNLSLAMLATAIPLAHHGALALERRARDELTLRWGGDREPHPVLLGALIAAVVLSGRLFSPRLPTFKPMPESAIGFMRENGLGGNVLADFDWAGYVLWHLGDGTRVFVDGRAETAYPDSILSQYLRFFYGRPGGAAILSAYPHDCVLVRKASGAFDVMSADPRWTVVYRDDLAAVFAHTGSSITPQLNGTSPTRTYFP